MVDNYGDAGVCWRLARQLAGEHGAPVTLVIDSPQVLEAIAPGARPQAMFEGVAIESWPGRVLRVGPGVVVVSAFGCALPPPVRAAIAGALWVNLEYLSAESWIDGCHGLCSRKPDDGAIEHFYYPGFTDASGGLPRERDLIARRDAQRRPTARAQAQDGPGGPRRLPGPRPRRVSLFCYPQAPVRELLEAIASADVPTTVLVPVGIAETALAALAGELPAPGVPVRVGRLRIERFVLLPQPEFDRLLWSCDLNFVRGEDSWVRAIWAGRPFVWQPYFQDEGAHLAKLEAFVARFESLARATMPAAEFADTATRAADREPLARAGAMMRAWSGVGSLDPAWAAFAGSLDRIAPAYERVSDKLAAATDLATRLVEFARVRL